MRSHKRDEDALAKRYVGGQWIKVDDVEGSGDAWPSADALALMAKLASEHRRMGFRSGYDEQIRDLGPDDVRIDAWYLDDERVVEVSLGEITARASSIRLALSRWFSAARALVEPEV